MNDYRSSMGRAELFFCTKVGHIRSFMSVFFCRGVHRAEHERAVTLQYIPTVFEPSPNCEGATTFLLQVSSLAREGVSLACASRIHRRRAAQETSAIKKLLLSLPFHTYVHALFVTSIHMHLLTTNRCIAFYCVVCVLALSISTY